VEALRRVRLRPAQWPQPPLGEEAPSGSRLGDHEDSASRRIEALSAIRPHAESTGGSIGRSISSIPLAAQTIANASASPVALRLARSEGVR